MGRCWNHKVSRRFHPPHFLNFIRQQVHAELLDNHTKEEGEFLFQLSAENDSGKTFVEIADIIEKHWQEL